MDSSRLRRGEDGTYRGRPDHRHAVFVTAPTPATAHPVPPRPASSRPAPPPLAPPRPKRTPPTARTLSSWQEAEVQMAAWMRYYGYPDARTTGGGADGGIDVTSREAVAQVKFQHGEVSAPLVQALFGAAACVHKQAFFFARNGYTGPARDFALQAMVCLFTFDAQGRPTPVNTWAWKVQDRLHR